MGERDHRIVGRVGRLTGRDSWGRLSYPPYQQTKFNLVLTGLAFLDKTMASWYWEDDPLVIEARKHVDTVGNCEDILLNCKCNRLTSRCLAEKLLSFLVFNRYRGS